MILCKSRAGKTRLLPESMFFPFLERLAIANGKPKSSSIHLLKL
jgi:hypothetical protein